MVKLPIRSQVIAPPGYSLVAFDLSQAEAWVVAYLAGDETMKRELAYGDIHSYSARVIYDLPDTATRENGGISKNQRYIGKKFNHSCNYRTGPYMIVISINKESDKEPYVTITIREAKKFHIKWLSAFNLSGWWKDIEDRLNANRMLITPYLRKRVFYQQWGDSLFKEATAFVPQSTVADHMFGAIQPEIGRSGGLLGIYSNIVIPSKGGIRITNTSHDSCILEVPKGCEKEIAEQCKRELLRPIMIRGEIFTIPVDCEWGERYGELEKLSI